MAFSKLKRVIALALTIFSMVTAVHAVDLPVKNLGFEEWNAEKTKPSGWGVGGTGYESAADCDVALKAPEGKCALRLESTPSVKTGGFIPVTQRLPSQVAAGHQIKLSGFIRTENVQEGWAGMWLRVDAQSKPAVAFDNMAARGPRGTTGWQRFEIALPVAPNTNNIAFGVLLKGTGTAWFDGLRLEVDESIQVPKVDIPEIAAIAAPPRPQIPHALLDDKALALSAAEMPDLNEAWRIDIQQRHHAIRSLSSGDFSDLQFLKPLLKNKRVIQLGESSHGIAEFNWMKVRLVKFLHQELGYDVIAFESSLTGCDSADRMIGKVSPLDVMRECIFGVWHTNEVLPLFDYLDTARKTNKRITLAGFDTQNSGTGSRETGTRFKGMLERANSDLARLVEVNERRLRVGLASADATELIDYYRDTGETLTKNSDKLRVLLNARPEEVDLSIQEAKSRVLFVRQLEAGPGIVGTRIRDKGMADNLDFLLDRLYPGRKIIVWAHNFHVTYQQDGQEKPVAMGAWVAERRKADVYTIGLFMGRGVGATNSRSLQEIMPPAIGTLEAIMANAGRKMSFVDFSQATRDPGNSWIFEPINAREWGISSLKLTPAKMYDAVLYIDSATPPQYIPFVKP